MRVRSTGCFGQPASCAAALAEWRLPGQDQESEALLDMSRTLAVVVDVADQSWPTVSRIAAALRSRPPSRPALTPARRRPGAGRGSGSIAAVGARRRVLVGRSFSTTANGPRRLRHAAWSRQRRPPGIVGVAGAQRHRHPGPRLADAGDLPPHNRGRFWSSAMAIRAPPPSRCESGSQRRVHGIASPPGSSRRNVSTKG